MRAFFSEKLSPPGKTVIASDRDLLLLICFSESFGCYFEGVELEIITDIQVLRYFSDNCKLSNSQAGWFERLESFGIFTSSPKPEKICVLGDLLYKTQNDEPVVSDAERSILRYKKRLR